MCDISSSSAETQSMGWVGVVDLTGFVECVKPTLHGT